MKIFKRFKLSMAAVVTAAALLFAGGVAFASIPNADGTISACYKNTDGSLKVVDTGQSCPNGYTALALQGPVNQTGILYGVYTAQQTATVPAGKEAGYSQQADCTTGDKALGGGYYANIPNNPDVPIRVFASYPYLANGWLVRFAQDSDTQGFSITVYAICAKVKP